MGYELGESVGGDRIHAEDKHWLGPAAAPFLDIEDAIAQRKQHQREASSEEHEGTCPQFFVDGKPGIEKLASGEASDAGGEYPRSFRMTRALAPQPLSR